MAFEFDDACKALEGLIEGEVDPGWWESRSDIIQAEFYSGLVRIAVVGRFKAGKSTLVNAIIAEDLMPRDATPTTAVAVEVLAGPERQFIQLTNFNVVGEGDEQLLDEDEFRARARGESGDEELVLLRASLPHLQSKLPDRVAITDTPGVDSLEEMHSRIAYGYLTTCDAVVVAIDGEHGGLIEPEIRFARDHLNKKTREKLVFVVTKLDNKPEGDRVRVLEAVRSGLQIQAGIENPPVIAVCATDALEARLDGADPEPSDFRGFMELLDDRFIANTASLRADRGWRTLAATLAEAKSILLAKSDGLNLNNPELEERIRGLLDGRVKLERTRQSIEKKLDVEFSSLHAELDTEIGCVLSRVADKAPEYLRSLEGTGEDHDRVSNLIRKDLTHEIEGFSQEWLKPRVEDLLVSLSEDYRELQTALPEIPGIKTDLPGGGVLIDIVVEGGLIVLLNVLLPGEWLVALLGRVIGSKSLDKLLEPIKKILNNVLQGMLRHVMRTVLENRIRETVNSLKPELVESVYGNVESLVRTLSTQVLAQIDEQSLELTRATQKARDVKKEGVKKVDAEKRRLASAIDKIERIEMSHKTRLAGSIA